MATKKTIAPEAEVIEEIQPVEPENLDPFEKVPCKIPKIPGRDDPVYVSVNDYSCTITRGKTVQVPRFVKMEVERSEAAIDALESTKDKLLEQSE